MMGTALIVEDDPDQATLVSQLIDHEADIRPVVGGTGPRRPRRWPAGCRPT